MEKYRDKVSIKEITLFYFVMSSYSMPRIVMDKLDKAPLLMNSFKLMMILLLRIVNDYGDKFYSIFCLK